MYILYTKYVVCTAVLNIFIFQYDPQVLKENPYKTKGITKFSHTKVKVKLQLPRV